MRLSMPTEKHAIGASTKRSLYNLSSFHSPAFTCAASFDIACMAPPKCLRWKHKISVIACLAHSRRLESQRQRLQGTRNLPVTVPWSSKLTSFQLPALGEVAA